MNKIFEYQPQIFNAASCWLLHCRFLVSDCVFVVHLMLINQEFAETVGEGTCLVLLSFCMERSEDR